MKPKASPNKLTLKSKVGTQSAVVEVCQFHLGAKFVENSYEGLFSPQWILDTSRAHAADLGAQQEAILEIEKSLRRAFSNFNSLHPDIRRAVEAQVRNNLANDEPGVWLQETFLDNGEVTSLVSYDCFELRLRSALSSFLGVGADRANLETLHASKTRSVRSAAETVLSGVAVSNLSHQARHSETWEKAAMVKRCRAYWQEARGKQAPKTYSGKFAEFLDDMIDALGKRDDWKDPRSVMNAWSNLSKENDWLA